MDMCKAFAATSPLAYPHELIEQAERPIIFFAKPTTYTPKNKFAHKKKKKSKRNNDAQNTPPILVISCEKGGKSERVEKKKRRKGEGVSRHMQVMFVLYTVGGGGLAYFTHRYV